MLLGSNAIVDVAVGLALMFLIVSLMATVLNELVATKLKLRASTLQGALKNILDSDTLRADFYDHGLIAGTHDAVGGHPSYLSGRDFALAVIGSLDVTKPVPALGDINFRCSPCMVDCASQIRHRRPILGQNGIF